MDKRALYETAPLLTVGFGLLIFLTAATYHLLEASGIGVLTAPVIAFLVDGLPALGIVYGGYFLTTQNLDSRDEWRVFLGTIGGSAVVGAAVLLGIAVRLNEGRPVSEPVFQVLLGVTIGAITGFVGGYYYARSSENAREATETMSTLGFTNRVLRHDIKNDMTVIKGRANIIIDADPDDELIEESARTIDRQVQKVLDVIDSTGAISEALSPDREFGSVDLVPIVEEVVDHSDDSLPGTVTAEVPASAEIRANESVRTVVSNLVENGLEHNDSDDPWVFVTIEPNEETVELCVEDNGPGVPDGEKREIFEPRLEDTGRGGLHVVRTLVESYGGSIHVEDNQPRGSVFVTSFPRA